MNVGLVELVPLQALAEAVDIGEQNSPSPVVCALERVAKPLLNFVRDHDRAERQVGRPPRSALAAHELAELVLTGRWAERVDAQHAGCTVALRDRAAEEEALLSTHSIVR